VDHTYLYYIISAIKKQIYPVSKQQAYKNLDPEQTFGELFGNSKLKQSIGLVYVPWKLAEELVESLP
jgi:hypothetical protein